MKLNVNVERLEPLRFRASIGLPWDVSIEAPSRFEAIESMKQLLAEKMARTEVVEVEVPDTTPHPWAAICGQWRDHPDIAEFEANIREYRRQIDADPERA